MDSRQGRRSPCLRVMVFVLWSVFSAAVGAAVIDRAAEEQLLQQERERQLRDQQEISPDGRLPSPASSPELFVYPDSEFSCFTISTVTLTGENAVDFQFALSAVTDDEDPATGRCLGAQGINVAMSRIQNAIIARGFVTTRVLAAPQDLNSGLLQLTVIPGKVRKIQFAEGVTARATKWNAMPVKQGDILNLREIEQGLENFKRIPTAEVDIQIEPAAGPDALPGESDVRHINYVGDSEMKYLIILGLHFLALLTSGCGIESALSGKAYDDYQRSIKPYITYWGKEGMTEESRLSDWVACGGSRNGSFGINVQDRLPDESQATSQNRQQTDFQRCIIRAGYHYTGNCSSDWAKTRPACGAP